MYNPIGALCNIAWVDTFDRPFERYISFGQYDEDEEDDTDEFGIPDTDIFFYAFEGEEQLKKLMSATHTTEEFIVLGYELVYAENKESVLWSRCLKGEQNEI